MVRNGSANLVFMTSVFYRPAKIINSTLLKTQSMFGEWFKSQTKNSELANDHDRTDSHSATKFTATTRTNNVAAQTVIPDVNTCVDAIDDVRIDFPPCTIMVIDDIGETYVRLRQILSYCHFAWVHVSNQYSLLRNVDTYQPDLVFADMYTPRGNTYHMIQQFRSWEQEKLQRYFAQKHGKTSSETQFSQRIPVIAFTPRNQCARKQNVTCAGCTIILNKPVVVHELINSMRECIPSWESPIPVRLQKITDPLILLDWNVNREYWIQQCHYLARIMVIDDIHALADEIVSFGNRIQSDVLIHWVKKLRFALDSYDLLKVKDQLLTIESIEL